MRRSAGDRVRGGTQGLRRYRCRAPECGFSGLLAHHRGAGRHQALAATMARRTRLAWVLALLAGLVFAAAASALVLRLGWQPLDRLAHPGGAQRLAPGMQYDGEPVPAPQTVALAAGPAAAPASAPSGASAGAAAEADEPGLALRQNCIWGRPGRQPYQGTAEQALRAGGVPADLVTPLAARIRARQVTDRVDIRRQGIRARADGREFSARGLALSFGRSMCLDSRVNFKPGHAEPADFYEVRDSAGRMHRVIVPDVCGNVSVLSAGGERSTASRLMAGAGHWLLDHLAVDTVDDDWQVQEAVALAEGRHAVPEPATLWSVLAALAGLAWVGSRRR